MLRYANAWKFLIEFNSNEKIITPMASSIVIFVSPGLSAEKLCLIIYVSEECISWFEVFLNSFQLSDVKKNYFSSLNPSLKTGLYFSKSNRFIGNFKVFKVMGQFIYQASGLKKIVKQI